MTYMARGGDSSAARHQSQCPIFFTPCPWLQPALVFSFSFELPCGLVGGSGAKMEGGAACKL